LPGYDVQWNNQKKINQSEEIKTVGKKEIGKISFVKEIIARSKTFPDTAVRIMKNNYQTNSIPSIHVKKSLVTNSTENFPVFLPDTLKSKQQTGVQHTNSPPEHPLATASMFFAAASFGFLLIALGFGLVFGAIAILALILSEIAAIYAISDGKKAKREIEKNPGKYSGRGLARIGKTIAGIIIIPLSIGLALLLIIYSALLLATR
jgi:hypothetical protein